MKFRGRKIILAGSLMVAGAVAILLMVVLYVVFSSPVSRSKLRQVQAGMSTNEIVQILGRPTVAHQASGYYHYWDYTASFSLQVVRVGFDEQGFCTGYHFD